jgi:hypothetical protein
MRVVFLLLGLALVLNADFFNQQSDEKAKEEKAENSRLCKIFTEKLNDYKKTMRDDEYAHITLKSYEQRAEMFCKKVGQ